jgi:prepilin-type N-terminal cleavage/methylation domain-containing protein
MMTSFIERPLLRPRAGGATAGRSTGRRGFSLIEVMVAMTILSIVLLSLAKVSVAVTQRGRTNTLIAKRNAAMQLEGNKLGGLPFSKLSSWASGTDTATANGFTYKRRLTISKPTATRYSIKIVILPVSDTTKKDSLSFDRTQPPSGTPLCVGC